MTPKPKLLTQNSELRKVGVWNWSIPAHVIQLSNGERFNTCPNAKACGRICYAKFGTYQFPSVKKRHLANLEMVLNDPDSWQDQMITELNAKKFRPSGQPHNLIHSEYDSWLIGWIHAGGRAVRIHDAGDFFSWDYLMRWAEIAIAHEDVLFYAYTKEVGMVQDFWATEKAGYALNLRFIFSFGGKQDHLINRDAHRHADVFPDAMTLEMAGYWDQNDSDLIAITAPTTRIGIVQNNLPVPKRRFAGRTLSELNFSDE